MTAKARQGRDKHLSRSKRKRGRRAPAAIAPQPPAVSRSGEPVAVEEAVVDMGQPVTQTRAAVGRQVNIMPELRRVAIFGSVALAVLVVLALVFS